MSILLADIDATCASLGYNDGTRYHIEPDSLQGLKVRFSSMKFFCLIKMINEYFFLSSTLYGFYEGTEKLMSTVVIWERQKFYKLIYCRCSSIIAMIQKYLMFF